MVHAAHMKARAVRYWLRMYWALAKIRARMRQAQEQKPAGRTEEIIISLTSHRPRFKTLGYTLECLLRQTVAPYRLMLWIDEPDMPYLPADILAMKERGLEICQTPKNLGPYNKIIHTLRAHPGALIVTADDDIYYQADFLEMLLRNWSGDAKEIVCAMACTIPVDAKGEKKSFAYWKPVIGKYFARTDIIPYGVGGVLYPPGSLSPEVLDESAFMNACPRADDLWLFWMARRNGTVYRKIDEILWPVEWPSSQAVALKYDNNAFRNDEQVSNLVRLYGWPSPE